MIKEFPSDKLPAENSEEFLQEIGEALEKLLAGGEYPYYSDMWLTTFPDIDKELGAVRYTGSAVDYPCISIEVKRHDIIDLVLVDINSRYDDRYRSMAEFVKSHTV